MNDLSKKSATELQQMLTNIYTIITSYNPDECTKLERISIMFEDDSVELAALLEYHPEEYFRQKYSKEPLHTEEQAVSLVQSCKDADALKCLKQMIIKDRPKYPPQSYERIMKDIYLLEFEIKNSVRSERTVPSISGYINEEGQDSESFFPFDHMAHLIMTADGLKTLQVLKSNIDKWQSNYEPGQREALQAMVNNEIKPYKLLLN